MLMVMKAMVNIVVSLKDLKQLAKKHLMEHLLP
jgi:hypothetical protein